MTVIIAYGRQMGSDSMSFCNGIGYPVAHPKIARTPDGSLVGAAGSSIDCEIHQKWAQAGMDFDNLPDFSNGNDKEGVVWLWLRQDGRLFFGDHYFHVHEVSLPTAIGADIAAIYAEALIAGGCSLKKALTITLKKCNNVGGEPFIMSLPR
jgi:hypothetical protein